MDLLRELDSQDGVWLLFFHRLMEKGFNSAQIRLICEVLENICPHCYDDEVGCQCWNDE